MKQQLLNFHFALVSQFPNAEISVPQNWISAFQMLIKLLEKQKSLRKKKVIFFDEMPWMDSARSDFMPALENFWNAWASSRDDIVLIACGSATSWMTNKLINNKGGLHNRVTQRLKILPFTLNECKQYLLSHHIDWEYRDIVMSYMVFGGIPFYLSLLKSNLSLYQNVDSLFFSEDGVLRNEFKNLYASLFKHSENHIAIVKALSKKTRGLTRDEIIASAKISNGGGISKNLGELESCGFIRKYNSIGKKSKLPVYQLVDFYTLFYFHIIEGNTNNDENFWMNKANFEKINSWSGFSFEQVCLSHIYQIKKKLGITGVSTNVASWRSSEVEKGAQIDLVIDRKDNSINVCEMKFSSDEFTIDKSYSETLRNKIAAFKRETKTRKSVFLTMITTFGTKKNKYYMGMVQNEVVMEDLFE